MLSFANLVTLVLIATVCAQPAQGATIGTAAKPSGAQALKLRNESRIAPTVLNRLRTRLTRRDMVAALLKNAKTRALVACEAQSKGYSGGPLEGGGQVPRD